MNNALCLICLRPSKLWCDFFSTFKTYKIFIIIDDNCFNYMELKDTYKNITFIKVQERYCVSLGYIKVGSLTRKLITGWDKALYYFSIENTLYDNVWFIEDDVYFYNEDTLINLDKKYQDADLICNTCGINETGQKDSWLWHKIDINFPPPYYCGMMCANRMSNKMLNCINNYANENNKLFFLEALIPTIGIKNNVNVVFAPELNEILYRHIVKNPNKSNLYHPVKNLESHIEFRKKKTNR